MQKHVITLREPFPRGFTEVQNRLTFITANQCFFSGLSVYTSNSTAQKIFETIWINFHKARKHEWYVCTYCEVIIDYTLMLAFTYLNQSYTTLLPILHYKKGALVLDLYLVQVVAGV